MRRGLWALLALAIAACQQIEGIERKSPPEPGAAAPPASDADGGDAAPE